jgi:hypothetical protein
VKYVKHNFLPGRQFVDFVDLTEQLADWNATIADVRVHGTTHEQPIARFVAEKSALIPTSSQPSFAHGGRCSRIVASDYLVTFETNRYSVPFRFIGQTVEVQKSHGQLTFFHRGRAIAEHPQLTGQHQLRILPEHGPGAIARNVRHRYGLAGAISSIADEPAVEVRDPSLYEQLLAAPTAEEAIT